LNKFLYKKTKIAFSEFEKQNNLQEKIFVVAGGVAANKGLRSMLIKLCEEQKLSEHVSTD
jgi:N6-L-threonylcarbamoyladenine synthase